MGDKKEDIPAIVTVLDIEEANELVDKYDYTIFSVDSVTVHVDMLGSRIEQPALAYTLVQSRALSK